MSPGPIVSKRFHNVCEAVATSAASILGLDFTLIFTTYYPLALTSKRRHPELARHPELVEGPRA